MREGKEVIIQEFLVKDNENYKLKPLGFIRDLEEETFLPNNTLSPPSPSGNNNS